MAEEKVRQVPLLVLAQRQGFPPIDDCNPSTALFHLMPLTLTEQFFADMAGWEAMKQARSLVAADKVLSSDWAPPLLKGVVQEGTNSYRAGLVMKSETNVENICTCRSAREWGTICAHSIAVGLHHLRSLQPAVPTPAVSRGATQRPAPTKSISPSHRGQALLRATAEDEGELLEVSLIFPPNLEEAIAKGRISICFEGKWRGGKAPLNALRPTQPFSLSPQDTRLLDEIETLAGGQTPGILVLPKDQLLSLLPVLAEHPRLFLGRATMLKVSNEAWAISLRATLQTSGEIIVELAPEAKVRGTIMGERAASEGKAEAWALNGPILQPLGLPEALFGILAGPVRLSRSQVPQFLNADWRQLQLRGNVQSNFHLEDFSVEPQTPAFLLHLAGGLAQLQAQLHCTYGPRIMNLGVSTKDESAWLPDPDSPTRYSTRDIRAERNAVSKLTSAGFSGPDPQGRFQLLGQNQVLNFFAREYARLQKEWKVTLEERLEKSTTANLERIEPRFEITSSGVQWFDLSVAFTTRTGERFSASEIQRLLLAGQSHTRLKSGKIAVIDTGAVEELQEVLLDCAPEQHSQGYRIASAQAGFLEASLRQQGWQARVPPGWKERALQQSGEAKLECPPLGDLENVLRPYQKSGVAWLHFLRENGFGGILADEMGLGKTLQTLAFLESVERGRGRADFHVGSQFQGAGGTEFAATLVVCPTSLIFNWVAEAKKFTPNLKALALHGTDRHGLFTHIPESDLVITSYALIRRDAEKYRQFEFDTVVLDEAQHIKNRQTQNAQAVKAIRSRHRLVLTGTPLENSVLDLWSIFDFLMPGYLGSAQDFRERYEVPIVRDRSASAQERLVRRLRPFILRRLKNEVAQDLPAKLEHVSFCELTGDQRSLYQQILEATRKEVLEAVGSQGLAKSRMVVLTALLRLRQICCDLRLLKLENVDPASSSGKLELFGELLEEALDGNHRVLVFSQFVTMLAFIKERLTAEGIEFCYLDGSTVNRGEVVDRFQKNEQIPVFLISLKAGGVGLNLTGADTVIHFDPWWNPAVEDQATDRAHRIGQSRVVTSYKLITRNTVEEKILSLQTRKRELINATLGGEEELAQALSWEEIQELLA